MKTDDTPGPYFLARHVPWTECGCEPRVSLDEGTYGATRIVYCPLHAAASEMLDLITAIAHSRGPNDQYDVLVNDARALLAKIEGQS